MYGCARFSPAPTVGCFRTPPERPFTHHFQFCPTRCRGSIVAGHDYVGGQRTGPLKKAAGIMSDVGLPDRQLPDLGGVSRRLFTV